VTLFEYFKGRKVGLAAHQEEDNDRVLVSNDSGKDYKGFPESLHLYRQLT
jgi:hypothetical protein